MKCNNCGNEVQDQARFCKYCGQKFEHQEQEKTVKCPSCGRELSKTAQFCKYCGSKVEKEAAETIQMPKSEYAKQRDHVSVKVQPKRKKPFKMILICIVILCVVGLAAIALKNFSADVLNILPIEKQEEDLDKEESKDDKKEDDDKEINEKKPEDDKDSEAEKDDVQEKKTENDNNKSANVKEGGLPTVEDPKKSAESSGAQKIFYNESTGHAYALFNYKNLKLKSFGEWEAFCEKLGGHLAIINDKQENDYIYKELTDIYNTETGEFMQTAFFGYTDQALEGAWNWVFDNQSDYKNWAPGQPNNKNGKENFATFSKDYKDGSWNDSQINKNSYWFICEWEQ